MSYCVNPNCHNRPNSDLDEVCQACQTSLFLDGGRFRVIEKISNSETSHPWEVFKVEDIKDPGSGKYKVLKTLKYNTADYVKWFDGERRILLGSNFPGIPKLETNFNIPEAPEIDRPEVRCLVMEYIDGVNLEEWLINNKLSESISDEIKAFQWLKEIVIILDYIHEKGYFHRDIKPANIMLSNHEDLTLIDYGHAVEIEDIPAQTRIYSSTYTAPEQREGRAVLQSDFYSLGQTFVQLMTGKQPPSSTDDDRDNWSSFTSFPNSPLIPLINWLRNIDVNKRPQNTEQILRVIYLLQKNSDWYRFNSEYTTNAIELVQDSQDSEKYLNIGSIIKENRSQVTQKKDTQIKLIVEKITNQFDCLVQEKDLKIRSVEMETGIKINQLQEEITKIKVQEQKKNKRRKLWMTLIGLISLLSIGANLFWLHEYNELVANIQSPSDTDLFPSSELLLSFGDRDIEKSYGSTNLSRDELSQKLKGIKLFGQRRYQEAFEEFYQLRSRKVPKKDPSILIYMNNAKVRYWHQKKPERSIYTIAAAIPAKIERGQHILFGVAHAQDKVVNPTFDGPYNHQVKDLNEEPAVYLEVAVADDGNSTKKSLEIAGKLADLSIQDTRKKTRSILAVVGHYTSEGTCAALPIYDQAGLTLISPTSSMSELRQKCHSSNQVFFRTISSSQFEARGAIELLKSSNIKNLKVTSFYKKDKATPVKDPGFSQDLFDLFREQFKNEFDQNLADGFDLSNPEEVSKGIENAKDANVIVLFPDGKADNDRVFNQALNAIEKANPDRIRLVISSSYLLSNEINKLQPGLLKKWHKKLIVAADWHSDPQCSNKKFVDRQHQLWGGDLNLTTASSYEGVQAISALFKQEINQRSDVREKLAKVNIKSDVFNNKNISFQPNGDRADITQRILLTPNANGNKFEMADDKQCLR
jgi:eukaryotic-like serine/threonine-protein kinase